MIKLASNAFLATKVSFINEIANLCERVGANVQIVAKAMGLDQRIGSKFLHAGPGFGGSCFPKDVSALIRTGNTVGHTMEIAQATARVNERQRKLMAEKIRQALEGLQGKTVAVLGLSFKPNTNDLRESPAMKIVEELMKDGAVVRVYDPVSMEEALKLLPGLVPCEDAYDAAKDADALVLLTEWNQFRNLDFGRMKSLLRRPIFVDLRNVYESDRMASLGFHYISIGRPAVKPVRS
jgi:UDPglucose 6-dehydrogenase